MRKCFTSIVKHRKAVIVAYIAAMLLSLYAMQFVEVNSDLSDYLPADSRSTVDLEIMETNFTADIPNAKLLVKEIPEKEAAQLCREIAGVEGVKDVMWISDFNVAGMPLAMLPDQLTERFYRDGNAEYTLTIDEEYSTRVLDDIRALTDRETCFSGSFVDSKVIQATARKEVLITVGIVIIFAAVLLSFTMSSFYEVAALILCLIGSVLLNNGTNIIRRTISSMTNTAASVLQMGVSVDYSIFLLHRYDIYRRQMGKEDAMIEAMCTSVTSVFSSSVTTIIGFTALVFMRYRIGLDMGIVLAKGVLLSLLTAFTLLPCVILGLDDLIQKHHHTPYGERSLRIRTLSSRVKYAAMGIFVIATVISAGLQTFNSYYYGMSHLYKDSHAVMTERREIRETFGNENTMVLLVPSGHEPEEQIMMDEIRKMRSFIRATSLTELLGTGIPANMIPDSYRDLLQSDKYDRIILYFDLEEEDEQTFNAIDEIKAHASYHFGDDYHLIGNSVSTYDLKTVISADNIRINFITGSAVFFILVVTFRSLIIPLILTLCIEGSAWICMASSLLMRQTLFYIGYLVVTSILLGCTVDYAILVTSRYIEIRLTDQRDHKPVLTSVELSASSVLTSALILSAGGAGLRFLRTNQLVAQLGGLLARGAMTAAVAVLLALPGFLSLYDRAKYRKTSVNGERDGETDA